MASHYTEKDPVRCWNILAEVLSYGETIPFVYAREGKKQVLRLTEGVGGWGYNDTSCEKYLLDDIQFALFDQNLPKIELTLSGKEDGPICSFWTFTFMKDGLTEAYHYYNTD